MPIPIPPSSPAAALVALAFLVAGCAPAGPVQNLLPPRSDDQTLRVLDLRYDAAVNQYRFKYNRHNLNDPCAFTDEILVDGDKMVSVHDDGPCFGMNRKVSALRIRRGWDELPTIAPPATRPTSSAPITLPSS